MKILKTIQRGGKKKDEKANQMYLPIGKQLIRGRSNWESVSISAKSGRLKKRFDELCNFTGNLGIAQSLKTSTFTRDKNILQ